MVANSGELLGWMADANLGTIRRVYVVAPIDEEREREENRWGMRFPFVNHLATPFVTQFENSVSVGWRVRGERCVRRWKLNLVGMASNWECLLTGEVLMGQMKICR